MTLPVCSWRRSPLVTTSPASHRCCFVILWSSSSLLALPGNCNIRAPGRWQPMETPPKEPLTNDTKHQQISTRRRLAMRHRMCLDPALWTTGRLEVWDVGYKVWSVWRVLRASGHHSLLPRFLRRPAGILWDFPYKNVRLVISTLI